MCGIVGGSLAAGGAAAGAGVNKRLLAGLARLEYRGYDSAGMAVLPPAAAAAGKGGGGRRLVVVGRVAKLRQAAAALPPAPCGIAHTRWATHGAPAQNNAHPLRAGAVFVVHNGIIENHAELRAELLAAGRVFAGETDTEAAAHLLDMRLQAGDSLPAAMRATAARLQGAFALAAMTQTANGEGEIVCYKKGAPLLIGEGEGGVFVASDSLALIGVAARAHRLQDEELALLHDGKARLWAANGKPQAGNWQTLPAKAEESQLGEYRHFMQKEIFAQPAAVAATIAPFVAAPPKIAERNKSKNNEIGGELLLRRFGAGAAAAFRRAKQISIVACGTSYHAGMVARHWLAQYGAPCVAHIASEYRVCPDPLAASSLCIAVSQSGETADTLRAMRAAKAAGATTLALVNAEDSALRREADFAFCMRAGVEIGVASTKAFTAQLAALALLAAAIAKAKRLLLPAAEGALLAGLRALPNKLEKALQSEPATKLWAGELARARSAVYIARAMHTGLALEGALKLKEISYIHAEGLPAGELKHGALALVDEALPVVAVAPKGAQAGKMANALQEVAARGGRLYVLTGGAGDALALPPAARVIDLPDDGGLLSPLIYAVPLQLLAYHTAKIKGTDIDKPRNLAKSVTVE